MWIVLAMMTALPLWAQGLPPTVANHPYGGHPRQVLDLFRAQSDRPTPLVLFIHGGGWGALDKSNAAKMLDIPRLLNAGISVAAINYRYVHDAARNGVRPPVKWPLEDAARALQYIRSRAAEWNIDKERIGATGGSAGACSSLWLAFHDDMAKPDSPDPVARESTRLWCAAVVGAQTSLDPHAMREWIPNSVYGGHAFFPRVNGESKEAEFQRFYEARESLLPFIRQYSPIEHASADDPPVWLSYSQTELAVKGQPQKDPTHSALFGMLLEEKLKPLGVETILTYPAKPAGPYRNATDYHLAKLKAPRAANGAPGRTEIRRTGDGFQLYRNGQPYPVKGVVYIGDQGGRFPMRDIAAHGANSIRSSGGRETLDEAHRLGLSVLVNLRLRKESVDKFDYDDSNAVAKQFEEVKRRVLELKDHPAVLAWVIGNELSVGYKNRQVWDAVNQVARFLHESDPNHPAMTVIGDGSVSRGDIVEIIKRAPDLDLLGINYYKGIEALPEKMRQYGWDKPHMVTEWGPTGEWQMPKTEWGPALEESSTDKARHFLERYRASIARDSSRCLGSYAFIWGSRLERTHTWYGMHLEGGEKTEVVDVLHHIWTGSWPSDRAPRIASMTLDGRPASRDFKFAPGSAHKAVVAADDSEGQPLSVRWEIREEVPRGGYAGMGEKHTAPLPDLVRAVPPYGAEVRTPPAPGAYRLFVYVTDGKSGGATANIPFQVLP